MTIDRIKEKALIAEPLTRDEAISVLSIEQDDMLVLLQAAYEVRRKFVGKSVQVQMLMNAKSGHCTENCHYCSQSCVSKAAIEKYPLKDVDELINGAKCAKEKNAVRYCMAMSGVKYSDELIRKLADSIRQIKATVDIQLCCSLGFLTEKQAVMLKEAGLNRVNHNLNTSRAHYKNICQTHTYDQRLSNLMLCKSIGLELCCGGLIGVGETKEDIVDLLFALKELQPDSIPINFLIPIKGTPFENEGNYLTPFYCLKTLCLARFLIPKADIRAAGGREFRLRSLMPLVLYPANSIFVSGYLTTSGQVTDEGLQMISDMGFYPELE